MVEEKPVVDIEENNLYAALCYVGVLVFVPILVKKNDKFVNFHIRQGLVILGVIIVSLIAAAWVEVVGNLLFLVIMLVDIFALVQALLGKTWRIPVIGDIADSFKL